MAVFDATIASKTANSYASAAEADDFFSLRLGSDTWSVATLATKESALVTATKQIDTSIVNIGQPPKLPAPLLGPRDTGYYPYQGRLALTLYYQTVGAWYKSSQDQALKFPRWWDRDLSGGLIIPPEVKEAVFEQAIFLLDNYTEIAKRQSVQAQGVELAKLGSLWEKYAAGSGRGFVLAPAAREHIRGYMNRVVSIT